MGERIILSKEHYAATPARARWVLRDPRLEANRVRQPPGLSNAGWLSVRQWCIENLSGDFALITDMFADEWLFFEDEDAVLFRMKWGQCDG